MAAQSVVVLVEYLQKLYAVWIDDALNLLRRQLLLEKMDVKQLFRFE